MAALYLILADCVLALHLVFVLWVVLGLANEEPAAAPVAACCLFGLGHSRRGDSLGLPPNPA